MQQEHIWQQEQVAVVHVQHDIIVQDEHLIIMQVVHSEEQHVIHYEVIIQEVQQEQQELHHVL